MTKQDIGQATISDMTNQVSDFQVAAINTDAATGAEETEWINTKWAIWHGYYKTIPEFKTAINGFATWVIGKGWEADERTTALLNNIRGWGEDTFLSILWNLIVVKKVSGDSFAEVIRNKDDGTLINLKPLDPGSIKTIVNGKGIVIRYEQINKITKESKRTFIPQDILHLCNDRIADEIHGTSITEAVEWVIDARMEAMKDWRRMSHRSTIRVMYIDADDTTKLTHVKKEYAQSIEKGELMLIPAKRGEAEFADLTVPPIQNFLDWIKYLENFFYQALGVPKVILGGSEEFTEASSKIGYLTFEQIYSKEVEELIKDLWSQLAIKITINKPASIENELLQSEAKNTGQVGFQPKETTATLERE